MRLLQYIRDLRHRWRHNRVQLRIKAYHAERTGIVTICHSEYAWRKVRNAHLKAEPACRACGTDKDLQVHHVKPWHVSQALRFEHSNLITLCQPCHFRFAHLLNWKDWNEQIRVLCATMRTMLDLAREQRHV
jgi:5-methylcytosine-specific restriction endonuclease McrA